MFLFWTKQIIYSDKLKYFVQDDDIIFDVLDIMANTILHKLKLGKFTHYYTFQIDYSVLNSLKFLPERIQKYIDKKEL